MDAKGKIRKICILGGGVAGWTAALYLARVLNIRTRPDTVICLVESPRLPHSAIDEGTYPVFKDFLRVLGFDEYEWMQECGATFKCGTRFVGWSGKEGFDQWTRDFQPYPFLFMGGHTSDEYGLYEWMKNGKKPFSFSHSLPHYLIEERKAPKHLGVSGDYVGEVEYSYHFDANQYIEACKKRAKALGVHHFEDSIVDVETDSQGFIQLLKGDSGRSYDGHLFIDSSGSVRYLIQACLQEPFESHAQSFLCDQLAVLKCNEDKEEIDAATVVTAHNSFYLSSTPLQKSTSYLLAYPEQFLSEDDAERHLEELTENKADAVRHLPMSVGKLRNSWVKNCVAIGLAHSCLDPLESTCLLMIQKELETLFQCFPDQRFSQDLQETYNSSVSEFYQTIRDFLVLHYSSSSRKDTEFWKKNTEDLVLSEALQVRLKKWEQGVLLRKDDDVFFGKGQNIGIGLGAYTSLLYGMGVFPSKMPLALHYLDARKCGGIWDLYCKKVQSFTNSLPGHRSFLSHVSQPNFFQGTKEGKRTILSSFENTL